MSETESSHGVPYESLESKIRRYFPKAASEPDGPKQEQSPVVHNNQLDAPFVHEKTTAQDSRTGGDPSRALDHLIEWISDDIYGLPRDQVQAPIGESGELPAPVDIVIPDAPLENFIDQYADYADVLEAPRVMHEIVAMQMVASVLNRNGLVIKNGAGNHSLDLWVLLLSGSGLGRSTLVSQSHGVLKSAGMENLIRDAAWGSEPAFMQNIAENPAGLFVWGELSEKLKKMNDSRFAGIKEWVTDRYDDLNRPEARKYRRTGKGNDTPTIEFTRPPRINILATSSEAWFFGNLQQSDSAGGFIPRFLLVRSPGRARSVAIPQELDKRKQEVLAACLSRIDKLRGPISLTAIEHLYEAWYGDAQRRFEQQPNKELSIAYFNRHRVHLLKLAVIYEAAASQQLNVSAEAWHRAVNMGGELEATIFSLLDTGMNSVGYGIKQYEEKVATGGPQGVTQSELTRAFQGVPPWEREARLKTLEESGTIHLIHRNTAGRPAKVWVHRDFLTEDAGC